MVVCLFVFVRSFARLFVREHGTISPILTRKTPSHREDDDTRRRDRSKTFAARHFVPDAPTMCALDDEAKPGYAVGSV